MARHSQKKSVGRQYKMLSSIDHGEFGTVKLACHRKTEALVAIKTIQITERRIKRILSEVSILKMLHHPNIICLYQVLVTAKHVHLVTEFAPGGNLYDLIIEDGPLQEEVAKKKFGQIVSAIKYCHTLDIVHRDIKPQNIVEDEDGLMKVIDFGLAAHQRPGTLLSGKCGTKRFAAPEILLGEPYDGKKSDVWSLGVLLYFMTAGFVPFQRVTDKDTGEEIVTQTYAIPSHFSGQLENLIHQMLTVPIEKRPFIEAIEEHPWVIKSELNMSPKTYPDTQIIDVLCGMGFNASEIRESLKNQKFDEPMGAYLILKEQEDKRVEYRSITSSKPLNLCPTPSPSESYPSVSGLPLVRRGSEPNFCPLHIWPSGEHGPVALAPSRYKVARSVSMPPISVDCTNKKSSTFSCYLHSGHGSDPCICRSLLEDELPVLPDQDYDIETSSPPQQMGCFERLRNSIRECLSRLSCLPRAWKKRTQQRFSKKVAPLKEAGGQTQ
ncbi:putative sperm motility kinase W [Rattus norvegicus]|uniref:putative sperm motility kinase W n=1 Tax=Rattus norvegicus TaxID=10116 RepID=UPI00001D030D|nr:putative sperm motility kinase W [Rattus norvegicus]XP_038940709.1 putative sperm motility kinase W [Rattus norvegicus]XP_038940710.1 putative sperm motility kinase W [Rattus norvegicus]XP_038940711.1 putative sperm motility kinase W [Rattus norvegicus]XP_038940712.1 putative sperm motility kinase W [Rattus norvegicus]XP_038940713.1 putative sperm motility kinase W [Rattus norvegicus]XP_038940714.1 putative sperm motility kinase W [Rattus norvegicus]XP_038940715.1 putative sperm motility 